MTSGLNSIRQLKNAISLDVPFRVLVKRVLKNYSNVTQLYCKLPSNKQFCGYNSLLKIGSLEN